MIHILLETEPFRRENLQFASRRLRRLVDLAPGLRREGSGDLRGTDASLCCGEDPGRGLLR
jgi:hypothetical protein